MPISTLITSDKFYNQITNEKTTDGNTVVNSSNLIGSIGSFFGRETTIKVTGYIRFAANTYSIFNEDGVAKINGSNEYEKSKS